MDGLRRSSESQEMLSNASGGSFKTGEGDTDTRDEVKYEHGKSNVEETTLGVLSSWYRDGESETKTDCALANSTGQPDQHATNVEILKSRDSRDFYIRNNGEENSYQVHRRNHKRRWDEPDDRSGVTESQVKSDSISVRASDPKLETESDIDRNDALESNLNDIKRRGLQFLNERAVFGEDGRVNVDESREVRLGIIEENNDRSLTREEMPIKENFEDHREQRHANLDRPRISDKTGRRPVDADNVEMEYDTVSNTRRDLGKDSSWDGRPKNRDNSWRDRAKDREHTKDTWKRKQDMESRDGETNLDSVREWESHRRGHDRVDVRPGGRKDGNRTEAVKTSSKYGISNENYDIIEIQTKSFDNGREEARPICGRESESDRKQQPDSQEFSYLKEQSCNTLGSAQSVDDVNDSYMDDDIDLPDRSPWSHGSDVQSEKSRGSRSNLATETAGKSSTGGILPLHANQESSNFGGTISQANKGNRMGRVGRARPVGRDNQQSSIPFGALGLPPSGTMQSLPPSMSPGHGPISQNVFIPPFQGPMMWPYARGIEMNMPNVPPGLPLVPPGLLGPGFAPVNASGAMVFNQSGRGRGMLPIMPGPNFNLMGPLICSDSQEKASGGWLANRSNSLLGKAPSRGEQNDYSQNFVDTGMRPQNYIRELELTSVVDDYPKLRELIQKKDEIVAKSASHPMYYKCDLREQMLSSEFFGTKFDVILVDPPWEEYVHRAPGVSDHLEYWTFEEIMNLTIEAITDTPSFIFLWVGDGVGLEQGRQCLKKWGFRRCEDICWVKTNKTNATPGLRHDSHTLFQRSKEHCLMGIKGTVRRSTDCHIIHANIDTDVIIAEEPPYGSTAKPEDMYRIIEHFALGRRRLELFGEDHNIRAGWVTVGKGLSSSNFSAEAYVKNFTDKDGKVWMGIGGRNPPPEAPHLVVTTPEIESLRPKSPMKNNQQQILHSSISLTPLNSNTKTNVNQEGAFTFSSNSNIPSSQPQPQPQPSMDKDVMLPCDDQQTGFTPPNADFESNVGVNL